MNNPEFFNKEIYSDNNVSIHVIDIDSIDEDLKNLLDSNIVKICEGENDFNSDITTIKKQIIAFLGTKSSDIKIGAIAEFFIHIYLNALGYKQECLFINLEERSIKKGFDGYYSICSETWIVESKSGHSTTLDISHEGKVKEAYKDLKKKLSGEVNNNPWANAFNHARAANSSRDILQELKAFSTRYINNDVYNDICNFNVIPCSTIFYYGDHQFNDKKEIIEQVKNNVQVLEYKNITALCINKRALNLFINYLQAD